MRSMSARSVSASIDTTRPRRLTCVYQSSPSSTVRATRGSARIQARRDRLASMLTSTRPFSHRYQVATEFGEPLGWRVAMTAGLALVRKASISGGTGGFDIAREYPGGVRWLAPINLLRYWLPGVCIVAG